MKKRILIALMLVLVLVMANALIACNTGDESTDTTGAISVIAREAGSGTRGAFEELIGFGDDTELVSTALLQSSTGSVITMISGSTGANSIGYISLGSLTSQVKALTVDGVAATVDNIVSGDYAIARNLNIAVAKDAADNGLRDDFWAFCMSSEGQAICEDAGFISSNSSATAYVATTFSETTLTVGGSTSVQPAMEKLVAAYQVLHPEVTISVEGGGSSTGMSSAISGTFDIGMASRDLKDSEIAELDYAVLAIDGIAVVVNTSNSFDNITVEQLLGIYTGTITTWDELLA